MSEKLFLSYPINKTEHPCSLTSTSGFSLTIYIKYSDYTLVLYPKFQDSSLCDCSDRIVSYLIRNPENGFSCDGTH